MSALHSRPPVHLHSPVRPVPAPCPRPEVCVTSPVPPVLAPRTRPPVCLQGPVRPVPAPCTRPEVRVTSPVPPVPAPHTRLPVPLQVTVSYYSIIDTMSWDLLCKIILYLLMMLVSIIEQTMLHAYVCESHCAMAVGSVWYTNTHIHCTSLLRYQLR